MKKIACRKDLSTLDNVQRDALVAALLTLKSNGKYDKYADQHDTYFGTAHGNPFFYPWHRKFLYNLEKELQEINPDIALPYWDSTKDQSSTELPWTPEFMGGTGNPVSGSFASWGIGRSLAVSGSLPTFEEIEDNRDLTPYANHWDPAEASHGPPHNWVGGNMSTVRSPEDPVFFLHHCFVDKWWSDWQLEHPGESPYQGTGDSSPTSPMAPWATIPNDVLDSVDLDYMYDTDPSRIDIQTGAIKFVDIPEGEEPVRGVVFEVVTCGLLTFNITNGPGSSFGTPFGTSVSVDPGNGAVRGETIVWISYQGTTKGESASGSVTIECSQTGESWVIPITANTVERPTVGVALILDKSASMEDDIGDGRSRNDLLVESASIFANVIQESNGIGIAAFDHDSNKVMDITVAGPPGAIFGTGRSDAIGHISVHSPNPSGNTSIGDGIEQGDSLMTAASSSFDETAMIVFTDGKENRSKYIADVSDIIGDKVFAIGLGTASDLNATALIELCNNSGGEMLLTDTIDPMDDFFKLSKYYLQILAGITNVDIVTDPEDWILPGEVHRISFEMNETDISQDVILLCPAANVVRMTLETPDGEIIDPIFASGAVGVTYVPGQTFSYYRITLPVVSPGGVAAKEGMWTAILEVDDKYYKRYLSTLDEKKGLFNQVAVHGVRYNLSVYSLSNLRLTGTLSQNSFEPGATINIRCVLTEYGLAFAGQAAVIADLTRPDGTIETLVLDKVNDGVFEIQVAANLTGVYTAHAKVEGKTARERPFTREHIFTAAVWKAGNDPFPTTSDDPDQSTRCLCKLLKCLLSDKVMTNQFEKRLMAQGIDLDQVRRCVDEWCQCGLSQRDERGKNKNAFPIGVDDLINTLQIQPDKIELMRLLLKEFTN